VFLGLAGGVAVLLAGGAWILARTRRHTTDGHTNNPTTRCRSRCRPAARCNELSPVLNGHHSIPRSVEPEHKPVSVSVARSIALFVVAAIAEMGLLQVQLTVVVTDHAA
jgi:hypothetical protein